MRTEELEIELVREIMKSLNDNVRLKVVTWDPQMETDEQPL